MWVIIMEGKILQDGYIKLSCRKTFLPLTNTFLEKLIFMLRLHGISNTTNYTNYCFKIYISDVINFNTF